jgi:CTP synthase (UTP-ammonia lyase)
MPEHLRIGLIGDHDPGVAAHAAIPPALEACGARLGIDVEPRWLDTDRVRDDDLAAARACDGLWCVPASPYRSAEGALAAIRHARTQAIPFLGTCGGFQHALIEYARNELGLADTAHAETDPGAARPLIVPLVCSMVEVTGSIRITPGTRAAAAYGRERTTERYHCNYGLNPEFESALERGPLRVSGRDDEGAARIVELPGDAFYVATLFQPERSSLPSAPHPLILAYVEAVLRHVMRRAALSP